MMMWEAWRAHSGVPRSHLCGRMVAVLRDAGAIGGAADASAGAARVSAGATLASS